MARDIRNVIKEIAEQVPNDQVSFPRMLKTLSDSVRYVAPEAMYGKWDVLQRIIIECIPPDKCPDAEWKFEVLSIFSTVSISEIKAFWENK
jgi:hypothetical protein